MNGANQAVSGGIGGFLAFFLLACALWLLMRNMNKRLQNVKYDEELEQQRQAAEADEHTVTRPAMRSVDEAVQDAEGRERGGRPLDGPDGLPGAPAGR